MAAHDNQNHEKQCSASLSVLNAKVTPHASPQLIQHLSPEQTDVFISCASALFMFVWTEVGSSLVFSPRILQEKMGQRPGSSRPLFDHSNASLCAGPEGQRPLHYAAERGHMAVLERLLAAKATVEAEDGDGREPRSSGRGPSCGDCADWIQRNSLRVTRVG